MDVPADSFSSPEGLPGPPRASPEAPNRPQKGSPGRPGDLLIPRRPMALRLHKPTGTIPDACASKSHPPRPGFAHQPQYPGYPQMRKTRGLVGLRPEPARLRGEVLRTRHLLSIPARASPRPRMESVSVASPRSWWCLIGRRFATWRSAVFRINI